MITLIFPYGRKISDVIKKLKGDYEILVAGKPNRILKGENVRFIEDGNLASSLMKCMRESRGDYIIILNDGVENAERLIKRMVSLAEKGADIVVGVREEKSLLARMLVNLLLPCSRRTRDPLSEIFLVRREVVNGMKMHPIGCKLLLEIMAEGEYGSIEEVPVEFNGESLFNGNYSAYSSHLLKIAWKRGEIKRFVKFGIVGGLSILFNEFLLWLMLLYDIHLIISSLVSIEAGILASFIMNELWTFRDRGGKGFAAYMKRMGKYNFASIIGLLINFFFLISLTQLLGMNPLKANIAGIAAAFIWNFLAHNLWTWHS